jgi:hypothetical protein
MVVVCLLLVNFFAINFCQAALPSVVPVVCQGDADISECNLSAVETLVLNIAQIILGVAGSLALLAFVYGGLMYIFSGGNPGYAKKGQDALKYAVIGLFLILASGVILKTIVKILTGA